MTQIEQILESKGRDVWTIGPDDTVLQAIEQMHARDIGALVVMENGRPIGIFSERQYTRNVFLKGRASPTTAVRDVMRSDVPYVRPDSSVEEGMAIMTDRRIRHLPVMEGDRLVGLVSIGDLVKSAIEHSEFVIDQLVHYISGTR